MEIVGAKIDEFEVPVCNSFRAKVLNDQLCYEIDLQKYSEKGNKDKELKIGFNFLMDYNEDKQVTIDNNFGKVSKLNLANTFVESDQNQHGFIYLDTIGKHQNIQSFRA